MFKEPLNPTPTLHHLAHGCRVFAVLGELWAPFLTSGWPFTGCLHPAAQGRCSPICPLPPKPLLGTDCSWVSSGSQMPWGHLPGMAPRREEDRHRGGRRQALPSTGWSPHHVAVESVGKSPVLTGLTARSSILCPRPPCPPPQLSYLLPVR